MEDWICTQIGARENYAVPRALHRCKVLNQLNTDAWIRPGTLLAWLNRDLRDRYHPELAQADVRAANARTVAFEGETRIRSRFGWQVMSARNEWFQERTVDQLKRNGLKVNGGRSTLFSYAYAAKFIFEFARSKGWRTVLGQIDPGPAEERIVKRLYEQNPEWRGNWSPAPINYWQQWRDECRLADYILVNSEWSRSGLIDEGIASEKISVVPLAFESPPKAASFHRDYPERFTHDRRLKVLFLGQISLRKGVKPLLEAAKLLSSEPVEFWFAGPLQMAVPEEFTTLPNIRWLGVISRKDVNRYYRSADVFILPTFSDGFGLTQLEAQAWKLPVIASRFCGDVVHDGVNGILLNNVSGSTIAEVLMSLVAAPRTLSIMSANSGVAEKFSLNSLATSLISL